MIVITGASGHLGNNLVRTLLKSKRKIRCLVLEGESLTPLRGLDVETVKGDIRDVNSLYRAFKDAEIVYHLASVISLLPRGIKLMREVNVTGAMNVAETCLDLGIRRLIYTSSIHALAEPVSGGILDERMPCDPKQIPMAYSKTKAEGTLEVLKVIDKGLDGVIMMPTGIIGPYDFKPSEIGQMLIDYVSGKISVRIKGGYDFVDVRDVALAHMLAAEKGRTGEKYILSGHWISVDEIMKEVSALTGVPLPRWKIPAKLISAIGHIFTAYSMVTGAKVLINQNSIGTLRDNLTISSTKAQKELGYTPRPIRKSIRDTLEWFIESGMLNSKGLLL